MKTQIHNRDKPRRTTVPYVCLDCENTFDVSGKEELGAFFPSQSVLCPRCDSREVYPL